MKKVLTYTILLFITSNVFSQNYNDPKNLDKLSFDQLYNNSAYRAIYAGDITELNRVLDFFSLSELNPIQLNILRNTIFAKHGYIFKSSDLISYFSNFSWYRGNVDFSESNFTDIDKTNIKFIRSYEDAYKSNSTINISKSDIVGVWQTNPYMAAGWNERFEFHNNGQLNWYNSQMFGAKRILMYSGKWRIAKSFLIFEVSKITYLKDGVISKEPNAVDGYTIEKAIKTEISVDYPIELKFPIEKPKQWKYEDMQRWSVNIGSFTWFRMADDPEKYN